MNRTLNLIIFGLVITMFFTLAVGLCQDDAKSRLMGSVFRSLSKAFVLTQDLDQTKNDLAAKITKMDEEKFYSFYYDFYEHVYDFQFLVNKYKLSEDVAREDVVKIIKSLNKNVLYEIIDNIPNEIILREFNRLISYTKKNGEDVNKLEQLSQILSRMIGKIKTKYLKVDTTSDIF